MKEPQKWAKKQQEKQLLVHKEILLLKNWENNLKIKKLKQSKTKTVSLSWYGTITDDLCKLLWKTTGEDRED